MAITAPRFGSELAWLPPAIALVWIGALTAAGDLGATAYALPLLAVGSALPAFILFKATQGRPYAIAAMFAFVLVLLDAKFDIPRDPAFQSTWQTWMKVAVWAALVGIAGMRWRRIAPILIGPEIILPLGYTTIALVSALWSVAPAFSGGAGLGLLAYLVLACIVVVDLRDETVIRLIVWTLLSFVCAAFAAAAVVPDVAWLKASLDEAGSPDRLQGFAGHPNALGIVAGLLMLMVAAARRQALIGGATFYGSLAIGFVALLATGSRTALIAALIAWGLVKARNSRFGAAAAIAILAASSLILLLGACDALPDITDMLGKLSRSGRGSEILTLTGRTDIWDIAWTNIMRKPFFGWGYYGTEQLIADSLDPRFADQAKHAHNMFLQSLLSVGFVGSLPGFAFIILLVGRFAMSPDPTRDQITLFILVLGFSESSIFGMPSALTLIFFWALVRDAAKRIPVAGLSKEPATRGSPRSSIGRSPRR
jgi:O-antigen ligase